MSGNKPKTAMDMNSAAEWIYALIDKELASLPEAERMDVLDLVDSDTDAGREISIPLMHIANKIRARASNEGDFEKVRAMRKGIHRANRADEQMHREIDEELDAEGIPRK